MPASLQPDLTTTDQTVEERQRLLPRLTLKLLFMLVTGAIFLTWVIRLMIGSETALYCMLTVLLMVVACLLSYAIFFLLSWSAARVVVAIRGTKPPKNPTAGLLIDSERWQ